MAGKRSLGDVPKYRERGNVVGKSYETLQRKIVALDRVNFFYGPTFCDTLRST